MRQLLIAAPVRLLAETLARKLGCGPGTWTLTLEFRDWRLRKAYRRHGPVGVDELELLAETGELGVESAA